MRPLPVRFALLTLLALSLVAGAVLAAPAALGSGSRDRTRDSERPANLPRAGIEDLVAYKARSRGSAVSVVRVAAARGPRQPVSTFGFDAILNQPPFPIPGDPTGALGDSVYLAAVNVHAVVYDRAGVAAPAFATPLRLLDLAPFPGGTIDFDPKVVYDHYTDQFVLLFLAVNDRLEQSWIVIATAPDATVADPATWCVRKIRADLVPRDGRQWADYPGLGFDDDHVTVTTNQFSFEFRFMYAQILSLAKEELYDCERDLTVTSFHGSFTRDPDGSKAFTIQPAVSYGPASRQHLVSFDFRRFAGNRVTLWRIKERAAGLSLHGTSLKVGLARTAPFGTQGGGDLVNENTLWDTGDLRLVNAVYDADLGILYTAHAVEKDLAAGDGYIESAIRWYGIDPAPRLDGSTVVAKGVIGTPGADAGWPAVVTDAAGNLVVAFSQASAINDEFLSAYAATVAPDEEEAQVVLLRAGEARYEGKPGHERWGDFNAASRDPLDPALVALVNQFAKAAEGGPTTADWQQRIDLVAP